MTLKNLFNKIDVSAFEEYTLAHISDDKNLMLEVLSIYQYLSTLQPTFAYAGARIILKEIRDGDKHKIVVYNTHLGSASDLLSMQIELQTISTLSDTDILFSILSELAFRMHDDERNEEEWDRIMDMQKAKWG